MKAKYAVLAAALVCAAGAFATDFTLKDGVSGLFDWTDGNNYVGDEAPQQKDLSATDRDAVIVPDNVTVVISNVMPNASLALINSLARIRPNGSRTRIVFAVEDGETLTLDCAVNYEGESSLCRGTLVKDGAGDLCLTAKPNRYTFSSGKIFGAFYVHMTVTNGLLKFSQDMEKPGSYVAFGRLIVNAPGVLLLPSPPDSVASSSVNALSLMGDGTIRSESTSYRYLYLEAGDGSAASPLEFSGRAEKANLCFRAKVYYNLTGTNSTGSGTLVVLGNHTVEGGRIGVRKFGKKGEPSSVGTQPGKIVLDSEDGFWLTSLRQAGDPIDECDKTVQIASGSGQGITVFDGGAVGGLKLTGEMQEHTSNVGQKRIMLTGTNSEECVMSSMVTRKTNSDYPTGGYTFHLTKRGSGTWRMANASSGLSGAIAVEDGTLKFDSIANKGTASSLGTALDLYRPVDSHGSALTEDDQVGYAFLLGDGTAEHEGNLEYVGTESTICSTRPLALNGKGRLTNASAMGFTFSDVYTVGTGDNVLTLDGDDTSAANVLTGVNDQKDGDGAPLSIVKDGAGTWKLTGDLSLRGSISVKKGTLLINNNYTWYKWIVKSTKYELAPAANTIQLTCGDFGLYSADGRRQNLNMSYQQVALPNLPAGYVGYGFTADDKFAPNNPTSNPCDLSLLCDGSVATMINFWYKTAPDQAYAGTSRNVPHDHPEQETTWLPIVMRLSDDALPVTRYDYATTANANTQVYRTKLYASADGLEWEEMEDGDKVVSPTGMWELAGRTVVNGEDAVHTNALGEVDGQEIPAIPSRYRSGYLTDVASYAVAPGATLKIRGNAAIGGLTVDPSGAGTIDGGTFAANGSIDVTGMAKDVKEMTVKFNLVNTSGFGNVANWTIMKDSVPTTKLSASVNEDGTITIRRAGLLLLVR